MNSPDLTQLRAQMAPTLAALEAERLQQLKSCKIAALWCAGLGLAVALFLWSQGLSWFALAPLLFALMAYGFIHGGANKTYARGFKMMVIPEVIQTFGELTFVAEAGLSERAFNTANLHGRPDRYGAEDLIEGRIGATRVQMSEVHAEREEKRTDSKGRTSTHYSTIFRGLFVVADFNKAFAGITYVLPEGLNLLGDWGQSLGGNLGGRGALVKLEDPDFERAFVVYSGDQIEARYLLSSALMRRFLALQAHFGGQVSAAFIGGALYLTIAKKDNWFEPPSLGTPLSFESIERTLWQLQTATGIIEDLDLNTRIWSKERSVRHLLTAGVTSFWGELPHRRSSRRIADANLLIQENSRWNEKILSLKCIVWSVNSTTSSPRAFASKALCVVAGLPPP